MSDTYEPRVKTVPNQRLLYSLCGPIAGACRTWPDCSDTAFQETCNPTKPNFSRPTAIAILLTLFIMGGWCCAYGQASLRPVTFMPQWIPQAQFAGYMVAQEKGFYREAGLDVTHLTGGPGKNCFASLAAEETTFCTGWLSTAILQRAAGLRLVNLAQMIQRSSLLLVAKKSSGIREPKDIENKRVGFWVGDFDAPGLFFLKKHNLRVQVIPNYTTVTVFLTGAVDAVAAMWYNEYHTILNCGFNPDELSVLKFADTGVNFPEDGLYCSEEMFASDLEVCLAFAEASLKGWKHAFDHPDETIEIVMRHARDANTGTNVAHQRWMLAAMKDLMTPDGNDEVFGRLSEEDYRRVSEALKEVNLIREIPEYTKFYRGPR